MTKCAEQIADEIYGLHCTIGHLETENARLRDLASLMRGCVVKGSDCDYCKKMNGDYACAYIMRELGIEDGVS